MIAFLLYLVWTLAYFALGLYLASFLDWALKPAPYLRFGREVRGRWRLYHFGHFRAVRRPDGSWDLQLNHTELYW